LDLELFFGVGGFEGFSLGRLLVMILGWDMMSHQLGNSNNFTSSWNWRRKNSVKNISNDQIQIFPPNFKISSLSKVHQKFTKATMKNTRKFNEPKKRTQKNSRYIKKPKKHNKIIDRFFNHLSINFSIPNPERDFSLHFEQKD
jgi:hypothetical protein